MKYILRPENLLLDYVGTQDHYEEFISLAGQVDVYKRQAQACPKQKNKAGETIMNQEQQFAKTLANQAKHRGNL